MISLAPNDWNLLRDELGHRASWRLRVLLCLVVTCLVVCGCGRSSDSLVLLVSGDTQGWITPCGCASNQSGGLARRATLVTEHRQQHEVLLLDAGGSAIGTGPYQRIKLEHLLIGMRRMGLAAHNIGASETEFSPEQLRELGNQNDVVWLSANLRDESGAPVGEQSIVFDRAGMRIAVTGVIDPSRVKHPQWRVQSALPAILDVLSDVEADVKIVLAYCDQSEMRTLTESLPEVDYLVGGPTGQTLGPTRVGPVTMMAATNKGKFLAEVVLQSSREGVSEKSSGIIEIHSQLAEQPEQIDNLDRYYARLRQQDFTARQAGLIERIAVEKSDYAIAGSEACIECHQPDAKVWHDSNHAHAWDVLRVKGAEYDPHCQQCHTTGYGLRGGFQNVAQSPSLVHVGCENCHGPSQAHVDNPRVRTPFQAKQECVRCHDHENSPEFEMEPYWNKIFHRGQPTTSDSAEILLEKSS